MKSRWRAYALVAILLISVAAGLAWHIQSKGLGEADTANNGPPFLLGVYTQSPSEQIKLEVDLYYNDSGTFVDVLLNAPPHDQIVLLSTQQDTIQSSGEQHAFKAIPSPSGQDDYYRYYELVQGETAFTGDPNGYDVATFRVPNSTISVGSDEVTARLPLIGQNEDDADYSPEAASPFDGSPVYLNPTLKPKYQIPDQTPSHYEIPELSSYPVTNLYWNPAHLTTTEKALGVGEAISGWNISSTPSNGTSDAGDYMWQGDYGLAGVLKAINPAAAESRDSDEFFSGIALATAAAALIALLQECKDEFSFRKNKKKSDSKESAPGHTTNNSEQSTNRPVPSGLGWPETREADFASTLSLSHQGATTLRHPMASAPSLLIRRRAR
jgi:hypothetical protein